MEYSQISTILNQTLVPNVLGETTTIAEDLSNLADLGTAISALTADQLKDVTGSFVAGVAATKFDSRTFKKMVGGLYKDYTMWPGIIQKVKAGLMTVTDDITTNLQNNTSYDPNVFHGFPIDVKVYTKDAGFELDWSIPHNMWKTAFQSPAELAKLVGFIENRAEQTINVQLFTLSLATLRALIAANGSKRIKLLTTYNATFGAQLTANQAEKDADFLKWAAEVIENLRSAMTDISSKYNDGTVVTYSPLEDIKVTLLTKFANDIRFNLTSDIRRPEAVSFGEYDTVNFWQNSGNAMLPDITVNGQIKTNLDADGSAGDITIEKVVGVVYDQYAAGITAHEENVRSQYNGKGDFTNYFRSIPAQYFVDTRDSAVVLTLE